MVVALALADIEVLLLVTNLDLVVQAHLLLKVDSHL
jgi:hypothetical protein